MTPEERRQVALEEGGHSVCQVVLGFGSKYASIRPGRQFSGIASGLGYDMPEGFNPDLFVLQQPPEVRATVERRIFIWLVGDLSALYLADEPSVGYSSDEAEQIAQAALDELGPRLAELVVEYEQREDLDVGDEVWASRFANAFAGPEVGPAYLAWLKIEAREFVLRYRHAILRVAAALERHGVLSGDAIAALVYPRKEIANHA